MRQDRDIPGLTSWLLAVIDAEKSGLESQNADAVESAQHEFDSGMERLRIALEGRTELSGPDRRALSDLQEAIDEHTTHITGLHHSYGRELHSIRAHAQIASYAPVKLDGTPTPRYYDRAG